jgi:hypothetical protein
MHSLVSVFHIIDVMHINPYSIFLQLSWIQSPPNDPLPPMEQRPSGTRMTPRYRAIIAAIRTLYHDHPEVRDLVTRRDTARGMFVSINNTSASYGTALRLVANAMLDVAVSSGRFQDMQPAIRDALVQDAREKLDARVAMLSGKGNAPVQQPKEDLGSSFPSQSLYGEQTNEYFGQGMCSGDVNGEC